MYVGYRADWYGEECGGLCSDLYTFLPDNQIVIGLPVQGGCEVDACHSYEIENGTMRVNGETYEIAVDGGALTINDVLMERVIPVGDDVKFADTFEHVGYKGTGLMGNFTQTWTYWMEFNEDGTFERSSFGLNTREPQLTESRRMIVTGAERMQSMVTRSC